MVIGQIEGRTRSRNGGLRLQERDLILGGIWRETVDSAAVPGIREDDDVSGSVDGQIGGIERIVPNNIQLARLRRPAVDVLPVRVYKIGAASFVPARPR